MISDFLINYITSFINFLGTRSFYAQLTLRRTSFSATHTKLCVVFKGTCVTLRQAMSFTRPCLSGMNS